MTRCPVCNRTATHKRPMMLVVYGCRYCRAVFHWLPGWKLEVISGGNR